ncbi:ubiquinol oxidase subunit II [Sphingomonas bacterium]|uniref:ubiquinol oxidase subunit II n=1 Tax=Sphingomonas bacterium TaxID=1895847 RepID=UPI00157572E6|nr:ubiquinol oxidase subunit II [Sphingomonas bacterium]
MISNAPPGRVRCATVSAATLGLGGCVPGILTPAGPVAAGERLILFDSLAIMLAIIIPVICLTIAFAWWFRAGNDKAKRLPDFAYSGRLELLVWSIPALVVMFLGGVAWVGSHELDPPKPLRSMNRAIDVDVVALDWKWLFIYPDLGIASVNRLVIPAGTPVSFRITSATVMNSFLVPQLGSQIYAMSGMTTRLNLMADHPGRYLGRSVHYSGKGFPDMRFVVHSVTPTQFGAWVAGTRTAGPVLDEPGFVALDRDSVDVKPYTYRSVAPKLFEAVVRNSGTLSTKTAVDGRLQ